MDEQIKPTGHIEYQSFYSDLNTYYEYVPNATHTVALAVFIKAGSRYETKENNGISHFIEHMLFRGTANYPTSATINKKIDILGGHTNAFTSKEYTGVFTTVRRESLKSAADLIANLVCRPRFKKDDIEKEKPVVIEELKMYDERDDKATQNLYKKLYGDYGYGLPIIGTEENIKSFTEWEILDYYNKMYVPSNMVIAIVGDCESSEVKKALAPFLHQDYGEDANIDRMHAKPPKCDPIEYDADNNIITEQVDSNNIYMIESIPSRFMFDNREKALVFQTLFSHGMSSMLFTRIREELGLCYSIHGGLSLRTDGATFDIHCECDPKNFSTIKEEINKILKGISDNGISSLVLEDAIEASINKRALVFQDVSDEAARIARNVAFTGHCYTHDTYNEIMRSTTVYNIQSFAIELYNSKPVYSVAGNVNDLK